MPVTALKGLSVQSAGSGAGVWGAGASTALNEGVIQILDKNLAGEFDISLTNVNVTVSAADAQNCNLRLTGTLTGNVSITNPNKGFYFVENLTSGAFTVTVTNGVAGTLVDQGARVPVFADATNGVRVMLPPALTVVNPDLTNVTLAVTDTYSVVNADIRKTLSCGGNKFYTVSFGTPGVYSSTFAVRVTNTDPARAKFLTIPGLSSFYLWPFQSVVVFLANGVWQVTPSATGIRYRPTGAFGTFFVDPVNGLDTNDGLAPGLGGAFRTIQRAVDICRVETDGFFTINLVDGTYQVGSGVFVNGAPTGIDQIAITGNALTPTNVVIQANVSGTCFDVQDNAILTLTGVHLTIVGNGAGTGVNSRQGAVCDLISVSFAQMIGGVHAQSHTWSSVNFLSDYTIFGGAAIHVSCAQNAYVNYGSFTVSLVGTPNFNFYLTGSTCGVFDNGGVPMHFVGVGTGTRYSVARNAVAIIEATLPGNVAGTTAAGGIFL